MSNAARVKFSEGLYASGRSMEDSLRLVGFPMAVGVSFFYERDFDLIFDFGDQLPCLHVNYPDGNLISHQFGRGVFEGETLGGTVDGPPVLFRRPAIPVASYVSFDLIADRYFWRYSDGSQAQDSGFFTGQTDRAIPCPPGWPIPNFLKEDSLKAGTQQTSD